MELCLAYRRSAQIAVSVARKAPVRLLWTVICFLLLIALVIVIRRATSFILSSAPPRVPEFADLDRNFIAHPTLTLVHIFPGLLFLLLGASQFMEPLRRRHLTFHRWAGRVSMVCGLIVGVTALIMAPQMSIGGLNESVATAFFAVYFLFALTRGFLLIRRRQMGLHREWMIRAYAIGLAIASIRPIMGVFFATSGLTHLGPHDFFGTAFWLGFSLHAVAAEVWINYTRPQPNLLANARSRVLR